MEEKHRNCAGLDVHRKTVVACFRIAHGIKVSGLESTARKLVEESSHQVQFAGFGVTKNGDNRLELRGIIWPREWHLIQEARQRARPGAHRHAVEISSTAMQ